MAHLSEVEGRHLPFSGISLWQKFVNSVNDHGDNVALVCTHQSSGHLSIPNTDLDDSAFRQNPYLRVKYRHLAEHINKFANVLLELGVEPGSTVFSFMPNLVEYCIAVWAAIKLGCVWVPINPRNLLNKQEVTYMVETALSCKSSQSAVFLATDARLAQDLDELSIGCRMTKIIVNDAIRDGWMNLPTLLKSASKIHPRNPSFSTALSPAPSFVVFTSGTTSLPKGMYWPVDNFAITMEGGLKESDHKPSDVTIVTAPNNHGSSMYWYFFGLGTGGTIVFPGPTFHPQVLMDTIIRESCTLIFLVPTMVHALLGIKASSGGKISSLRKIGLGGGMISPEIVRKCLNDLGAESVINVWGMTEGCSTTNRSTPIQELIDGNKVSVGFPPINIKIRVCAPNSKDPLPRGVPGELHCSSPTLVRGYIGKQSDDFYLDSDGRHWIITGDQATIDEKDRIFITGRYKEMIKRGGENIAPAAIELVLWQTPEIMPFDVQIVGARDTVAGEVPVAIYKGKSDTIIAQKIQQTVLSKIGPAHVPDQVISLDDLGLADYPRTTVGKVQKYKLVTTVQEFRDRENQALSMSGGRSSREISDSVKKIWKRALGYDVDETLSFASFADSITIMKTRDMIAKELGKQISLTDMIQAKNIVGQIKMLRDMSHETQTRKQQRPRREGPVTAKDIVTFQHRPAAFEKCKIFVENVLVKYNLTWDDVADVVPAYDYMSIANNNGVADTWSSTIVSLTKMNSIEEVQHVLKAVLSNWPIMTSLMIWNSAAFNSTLAHHVLLRQTDKIFDQIIHNYGSVKSVDDLDSIGNKYPIDNAATLPGPLSSACLISVESTNTVAIAFRLHHAIFDASSFMLFFDDLEHALGGQALQPHTDYKLWADSYYSLRTSLDAQAATEYHVDRLKDVSSHDCALWIDPNSVRINEDVLNYKFSIPELLKFRQYHPEISAPVILKTAWALMHAYRSQHTHVVFTNLQASRDRFPFIPRALEDLGHNFSATDVAGPTVTSVLNLIEIRPTETVLAFLTRMQADQDDLTKYASAPLHEIFEGIGEKNSSFFLDVLSRCRFNWVPGFGAMKADSKYANFDRIAYVSRMQVPGIAIMCGLGGNEGTTMYVDIRSCILSRKVRWEVGREIEGMCRWLIDPRNEGREVGGFIEGWRGVVDAPV